MLVADSNFLRNHVQFFHFLVDFLHVLWLQVRQRHIWCVLVCLDLGAVVVLHVGGAGYLVDPQLGQNFLFRRNDWIPEAAIRVLKRRVPVECLAANLLPQVLIVVLHYFFNGFSTTRNSSRFSQLVLLKNALPLCKRDGLQSVRHDRLGMVSVLKNDRCIVVSNQHAYFVLGAWIILLSGDCPCRLRQVSAFHTAEPICNTIRLLVISVACQLCLGSRR